MIRTAPAFFLMFVALTFLHAQSEPYEPPGEILVWGPLTWNAMVWFPQNLAGVEFAQVTPEDWARNLSHPWVWDNDGFAVNQIGHPYQGSLAYATSRGAGWGFAESLTSTVLGSVSWELFMENERPSRNDFLVTSLGGVSLGEMLYRLSEAARWEGEGETDSVGRTLLSWALSPGSHISGLLYGNPGPSGSYPLRLDAGLSGILSSAGGGLAEWEDGAVDPSGVYRIGQLHFNLLYGNAPDGGGVRPFDVFMLRGELGVGAEDFYASLFSEGLLWGVPVYAGREEGDFLGLFLHYDFVYNDIVNISANSLGAGFVHGLSRASRGERGLYYGLHLSFVINGGTECLFLKIRDAVQGDPEVERRNYDMGIGANGKIMAEYAFRGNFSLWGRYNAYLLYLYPAAVPEGGSSGTAWRDILELGFSKGMGDMFSFEAALTRGAGRTAYRERGNEEGRTLGFRIGLSWRLL